MKFSEVVKLTADEPVFETGFLLAGDVDARDVRRQLSRWAKAGKVYQLRRGLYSLAPPYQKVKPHPFVIANRMVRGSYVSCQSALAHYGLIPEYVPVVTSVTLGHPGSWSTLVGDFEFHHIKSGLWGGYQFRDVGGGQRAFVATPEKALLDLVHLHAAADSPGYLRELRLQNLERLDLSALCKWAELAGSPKLQRAADHIAELFIAEATGYEAL